MGYARDKSRQVIAEAIRDGQKHGLAGRSLEAHAWARCPFRLVEKESIQMFRDELKRQMKPFAVEPMGQKELF